MKILILVDHLKGNGGWSRYSCYLAEGLKNLGHEVLCLVGQKSEQDKIREKNVLSQPLRYLANPFVISRTSWRVNKEIKRFKPEIIHFAVEPYALMLPFLNIGTAKTVLTIHGTYSTMPWLLESFLKRRFCRLLSNRTFQKLDKIISVSHFTKRHCLKYFSDLDEKIDLNAKIEVISNGIDLSKHSIIDLSQKSENKDKRILFVGAVKGRKGILEAIKALKCYYNNYSKDFIYEIVGQYEQDEYYREIQKKIKDYNLEDKIFFRGRVSEQELKDYYFKADLFIMLSIPSWRRLEGFGLVFLEANARGVPCLGSVNSGCQEAIKEGISGYSVDPSQPEETALKIDLILNKKTIKPKNCIAWAQKNDYRLKIKQIIAVYQVKAIKLDIGCGKRKEPGFIGLDIDPESDADVIASALDLPYKDETVNEIQSIHLVEHLTPSECQKFFSEIFRVLKKGGTAYVRPDRDWSRKRLLSKCSDHKHRYSDKELQKIIEPLGFRKAEVKTKIYQVGLRLYQKIFINLVK